jgi:hypothetical protein
MKYAKANSLRTQETVARFGKSARHPLCLTALDLWELDAWLSNWTREAALAEEVVNRSKQLKKEMPALIEHCRKEQKEKEANEASALLRKIDKDLLDAQKRYEEVAKLRSMLQESRPVLVARFKREWDAAIRTANVPALRALKLVQKRWNNKKAFLGDSDRRTLEMLKMLRDEVSKAVVAKDGANAAYVEAAFGGNRALSDKAWQRRLTAREIQSRLVDAPGDRHAKEVRRLAKKLGIRLAKDQPGRKWKPCLPKQEPKRPLGRPRTKPGLELTEDIDRALSELFGESRGRARQPSENQFWDSTQAKRTAAEKRSAARKTAAG